MSDLISKQKTIEQLLADNDGIEREDAKAVMVCLEDVLEVIDEMPIAKPGTGKWTLTPMLPDIHRYKCSNCMSHHRARYDFCPSCGIRMLREDGEEE